MKKKPPNKNNILYFNYIIVICTLQIYNFFSFWRNNSIKKKGGLLMQTAFFVRVTCLEGYFLTTLRTVTPSGRVIRNV